MPEGVGVARRQALALLAVPHRQPAVAGKAVGGAAHRPGDGDARARLDRPVEEAPRRREVAQAEGLDVAVDRQRQGIVAVPRDRRAGPLRRRPSVALGIGRAHLADPQDVPPGRVGEGRRVGGVEGDRLLQKPPGPGEAVGIHLVELVEALEQQVVARQARRVLAQGPLQLALAHMRREVADQLEGDGVLEGEDLVDEALVMVGADDRAGAALDQRGADPQPAAMVLDRPVHDVAHAQAAPERRRVGAPAAIGQGRAAGDHEQVARGRQGADDPVGEAVGQGGTARLAAPERQHRDRGPRLGARRALAGAQARTGPQGEDPHRPGMVAQGQRPEIDRPRPRLGAGRGEHRLGHDHVAGLGIGLEAGRHVDAVAEHVAVLDDDLGEVDPHPEQEPRRLGIVLRRRVSRRWSARAQSAAGAASGKAAMKPSPVFLTIRPPWAATPGSMISPRKAFRRRWVASSAISLSRV